MEKSKKTPHYKMRILSGFTTLVLLVAVVGCLAIVLQSISQGYVQFFGHSLFRVVTGSMEPTIPIGSILVAQETPIDEVAVDDFVCFRSTNPGSAGMIVTHRVVSVYDTPDGVRCLRTKGDANLSVDANPVTQSYLIGRIIWRPGDGSTMAVIVEFITGEMGFLACVILPVLLIAVWIFRDAAKNLRKEIQQVEESLDRKAAEKKPAMTAEEYQAMMLRLEEEVRKEMEQDAQAHSADDTESAEETDDAVEEADAVAAETDGIVAEAEGIVEESDGAVADAPYSETTDAGNEG